MNIPENLLYTSEHEWAKIERDTVIVGITDYAQQSLGDIVYVELPDVGTELKKGVEFASIESVKAVSDIFSPVSGEVIEVNEEISDHPEYINQSPYDKGWIIKVKMSNPDELKELMNSTQYKELVEKESH